MNSGNLFHTSGPELEKDLSPNVFKFLRGTTIVVLTCLLVFTISNYLDISFFVFADLYTYYGMFGCMTCVSLPTCANVQLGLIGVCLFWYLYWVMIVIGMRSSLTIVVHVLILFSLSLLFSVVLALIGFFFGFAFLLCFFLLYVSQIKSLRLFEPCTFFIL